MENSVHASHLCVPTVQTTAKIDQMSDNGYQSSFISEKGLFWGRYKNTGLVFWGKKKRQKSLDTVTCNGRKIAYMPVIYVIPRTENIIHEYE